MTATSQQAERNSNFKSCPRMRHHNYSVVGEVNDAWWQLSSLNVFQPESGRPTLDLVDVVNSSGQPNRGQKVTFHDAEELDKYLAGNQTIGRTRFM